MPTSSDPGAVAPFSDQVVLLTGASSGIGLALARRLAGGGARLVLSARHVEGLDRWARDVGDPARLTVLPADLSRPEAADRLARAALDLHGRVDVLVNNAGVGYFALVEETRDEGVRRLFEVNTFAPLTLARALVPAMKEAGGGRIVNIVTVQGRAPIPSVGVYGASKTALAVLANVMRLEVEPFGVTVVNVYPGTVDTEFEVHAEREKGRIGLAPGGGVGRSVEVATEEILEAMAGPGGEVWLEPAGRRLATQALVEPRAVDRELAPLRDRLLHETAGTKPAELRVWQTWRLEIAQPCTLRCVHCPSRTGDAPSAPPGDPLLTEATWSALRPYLTEVADVRFLGCGDPLVHPRLVAWIGEVREAGARAGLRTNGKGLDPAAVEALLGVHVDHVEITLGGARRESYERTRPGDAFDAFCARVKDLTSKRHGVLTEVSFRFVLVREAREEIEAVVRLAADLGVDRVDFTHCDVVRDMESGRPSIFGRSSDPAVRALEKELRKARKVAKNLGVETHASSFVPEEQPVCIFDPRRSLFVRHDGSVAPCANLAIGGRTCFLGDTVTMPQKPYGRVGEGDLLELWRSPVSRTYRRTFDARVHAVEEVRSLVTFERSLRRLEETMEAAREEMPDAPEGCRECRYLYNL